MIMKRTKRYGGFLIGDRVQRKDGLFKELPNGIVTGMRYGFIYTKWTDLNGKDFGATFYPNRLINLTRQEECELNKEQLDKFTRKYFNQSADEYLKEDMEMTKKIIEDFCNPQKDLPIFDWRGTDFGEIQKDWRTKDLLKDEEEPTTEEMLKWICENKPELYECLKFMPLAKEEFKERVKSVYTAFNKECFRMCVERENENLRTNINPYPYNKDFSSTADF